MSCLPTNNNRLESIDIIRGIAIFGIFVVNFIDYINPMYVYPFYTGIDGLVRLFFNLIFQTKFYTIFSFLFGVSFYLFMNNAEKKGKSPYRLFSKRLFWLFIFGAIHFILLWYGDILHTYALIGFFLLLFYRRSPKTILIWSLLLTAAGIIIQYLMTMPPMQPEILPSDTYNPLFLWAPLVVQRTVVFLATFLLNTFLLTPELLGLFLFGLFCGKIDVFRRISEFLPTIRKIQIIALLLGIACSIPILLQFNVAGYSRLHSAFWVTLSGKALSLFYVTTILILLEHNRFTSFLNQFKYVGRTAFSNYIAQTIICTVILPIFISNTMSISLVQGLCFTIIIFSLQLITSKWWLTHFSFGPLEWLWRKLTYGTKK